MEERNNRIFKELKQNAGVFIVSLIIALVVNKAVLARADVCQSSMESTLKEKDVLFMEKISVHTNSFKKGQIVVFKSHNVDDDNYVKRIIGTEGDQVKISSGKVYINGKLVEEQYLDANTITNGGEFLRENQTYEVPKGCIFVLGDNREVSSDSRDFGPINKKDILGHVIIRLYPFNKIKGF